KSEAAASGQFTPEGIRAGALQYAVAKLAPTLHRGGQAIASAREEVAQRRAKLTVPVDKTDVVAFLARQETRTWLRSLPPDERNAYVSRLDQLDPDTVLAIVEKPAAMSGVLAADREQLVDRVLQKQHGEAIGELLELERGIEVANRAVEAAREAVVFEAGTDP